MTILMSISSRRPDSTLHGCGLALLIALLAACTVSVRPEKIVVRPILSYPQAPFELLGAIGIQTWADSGRASIESGLINYKVSDFTPILHDAVTQEARRANFHLNDTSPEAWLEVILDKLTLAWEDTGRERIDGSGKSRPVREPELTGVLRMRFRHPALGLDITEIARCHFKPIITAMRRAEYEAALGRALRDLVGEALQGLLAQLVTVQHRWSPLAHTLRLLVMPVRTDDAAWSEANRGAELLSTVLAAQISRDTLTASDVNDLLRKEHLKDLVGCDEVVCMTEIGKALDMDLLVTVRALAEERYLLFKVIDARQGRVVERWQMPWGDGRTGSQVSALTHFVRAVRWQESGTPQ